MLLPPVQKFITHKAENYLEAKLHTKVRIGEINLSLPKSIFIGDTYIESLSHDTLLYAHVIKIDVDFLGLIHNRLAVNSLKLEKLTAHITRAASDTDFNFSFILKAFASKSVAKPAQPEKSTPKKPFEFAIYNVYLKDINLSFQDARGGTDAEMKLGKLDMAISKMDLLKGKIDIKKINLENTFASVKLSGNTVPDTSSNTKASDFDINIDKVKFSGIVGQFKDLPGNQSFNLNLGQSEIGHTHFQLAAQKLDIGSLILNNSKADVAINENTGSVEVQSHVKKKDSSLSAVTKSENGPGWRVNLKKLDISATTVNFDNMAIKPVAKGIDYNHLGLNGLNILSNNISYKASQSTADIQQLGFMEKSGFKVKTFRAKIEFDSVQAMLKDFDINTDNTHISRAITIKYKSLQDLSNHLEDTYVLADLAESIIGYSDILFFVPGLANTAPFSKDHDGSARISANILGKISDLNLNSLLISAGTGTMVHVRGHIRNLPDMQKTNFDISIIEMHTNKQDISLFSPKGAIPNNIKLPQKIGGKGYFKGHLDNFNTHLAINTSDGDAVLNLGMILKPKSKLSSYTASITTNSLQIGRLISQQKTLGSMTMQAEITGTGFAVPDINAKIKVHVSEVTAMNYPYKNMDLKGIFKNETFEGSAEVKDSNLALTFEGDIGVKKDAPSYKFELNVLGADLHALHLVDSNISLKGKVDVEMVMNKDNDVNGTASLNDILILKNRQSYRIKSFALYSATHGDNDSIAIRSDFLNADFAGTMQLSQLPVVLENHLNHYFNIPNNTLTDNYEIQNFAFHIQILRTDLITDILYPKIQKLTTGPISGFYNSKKKIIQLNVDIPEIEYSGTTLDSLKFRVNSDPEKLTYDIAIQKLNSGITLENVRLNGRIKNDSIGTTLAVNDEKNKAKFMLALSLRSINNAINVKINNNGLIVNYMPWKVDPENNLSFGKEIYAHKVDISNNGSILSINSPQKPGSGSPLDINFKDFNLGDFTRWVQKDTLLAGGIINGNTTISDLNTSPLFKADMVVKSLSYKNDTLGDLQIKANNNSVGKYLADITLKGPNNNASLNGYLINGKTNSEIKLDVIINKLSLKGISKNHFCSTSP